jgi:hypothetical protein
VPWPGRRAGVNEVGPAARDEKASGVGAMRVAMGATAITYRATIAGASARLMKSLGYCRLVHSVAVSATPSPYQRATRMALTQNPRNSVRAAPSERSIKGQSPGASLRKIGFKKSR